MLLEGFSEVLALSPTCCNTDALPAPGTLTALRQRRGSGRNNKSWGRKGGGRCYVPRGHPAAGSAPGGALGRARPKPPPYLPRGLQPPVEPLRQEGCKVKPAWSPRSLGGVFFLFFFRGEAWSWATLRGFPLLSCSPCPRNPKAPVPGTLKPLSPRS